MTLSTCFHKAYTHGSFTKCPVGYVRICTYVWRDKMPAAVVDLPLIPYLLRMQSFSGPFYNWAHIKRRQSHLGVWTEVSPTRLIPLQVWRLIRNRSNLPPDFLIFCASNPSTSLCQNLLSLPRRFIVNEESRALELIMIQLCCWMTWSDFHVPQ